MTQSKFDLSNLPNLKIRVANEAESELAQRAPQTLTRNSFVSIVKVILGIAKDSAKKDNLTK